MEKKDLKKFMMGKLHKNTGIGRQKRQQIGWLGLILLLVNMQSVFSVQVAMKTMTYEPMYIESSKSLYKTDECYFSNADGIATPVNFGALDFTTDHSVTFQRIHKTLPHNYKISLSLSGLNYESVDCSCTGTPATCCTSTSPTNNLYIQAKSISSFGFKIEVKVERVSRLQFFKARYLAVNFPDTSVFHVYSGTFSSNSFLTLASTNLARQQDVTHTCVSPHTDYKIILILRGIDMRKYGNLYDWWVNLSLSSLTYCTLSFWGNGAARIKKVAYDLVYYKKSLIRNYAESMTTFHTKLFPITKRGGCVGPSGGGYGGCVAYTENALIAKIFPNNYFLGTDGLFNVGKIHYSIGINSNKLDAWLSQSASFRHQGVLFYGYECPSGFYLRTTYGTCVRCQSKCLYCDTTQCFQCPPNYVIQPATASCKFQTILPPEFYGCLFIEESDTVHKCHLCDQTKNMMLWTQLKGCTCMSGHYWEATSQTCKDFCGDGLVYSTQCDDANLISNDGCSVNCQEQPGFYCQTKPAGSKCYSIHELIYAIDDVSKDESDNDKGTIVLKPVTREMPFSLTKSDFQSFDGELDHIALAITVDSRQETLRAKLDKVENNLIYLGFYYEFTVEGLDAEINLDYSQTRYKKTTQKLDFKLKGSSLPLKYSNYQSQYDIVSKNFLATVILSMLGLLVGLFLPKFIGLETIITMQLIYFSQLLIVNYDEWPVGFLQFANLKAATGYNEVLDLTKYAPVTDLTKKYHRLFIHKTVLENLSVSFVVLTAFASLFYVTSLLMRKKEAEILELFQQTQDKKLAAKPMAKQFFKGYNLLKKVNETLYWVATQLAFWCLLPMASSVSSEILIDNSLVSLSDVDQTNSFLLSLRGFMFLVLFVVAFSIGLNLFLNVFLSVKTIRKMQERPEEILYKRMLWVYLNLMGFLIFFFNHIKIGNLIPVSVICLIVHLIFAIALPLIKPYKQSLRIHAVALYLNQALYFVFLVFINLINFVPDIDEFICLCMGYFVSGMVWLLIVLTLARLYYEIRYGEALEKKIQQERRIAKEEEKRRQEEKLRVKRNQLEMVAKQRLSERQKQRDLNKYLMETQVKETERENLLEWLETRNWSQEQKEQYFYKEFHEKPLQWLKENNKEDYKKKLERVQTEREAEIRKISAKKQDPDYRELVEKLRNEFEEKKKREERKEKRQRKKEQGKQND